MTSRGGYREFGCGPPAAAASPTALKTAVPAGAGAFHDRVRDGTGWVRVALGHGQAPPAPPVAPCLVPRSVMCCCMSMLAARLDGPALARLSARAPTRVEEDNALDHEHDSAPAVARLLPVASPPRRLRGVLPTRVVGGFILRRASHLDALSGSLFQTRLPGGACRHTTGPPAVCPARSSRTRAGPAQSPSAHGG